MFASGIDDDVESQMARPHVAVQETTINPIMVGRFTADDVADGAEDAEYSINVLSSNGDLIFAVTLASSASTWDAMQAIHAQGGPDPSEQCLSYQGRPLMPGQALRTTVPNGASVSLSTGREKAPPTRIPAINKSSPKWQVAMASALLSTVNVKSPKKDQTVDVIRSANQLSTADQV